MLFKVRVSEQTNVAHVEWISKEHQGSTPYGSLQSSLKMEWILLEDRPSIPWSSNGQHWSKLELLTQLYCFLNRHFILRLPSKHINICQLEFTHGFQAKGIHHQLLCLTVPTTTSPGEWHFVGFINASKTTPDTIKERGTIGYPHRSWTLACLVILSCDSTSRLKTHFEVYI